MATFLPAFNCILGCAARHYFALLSIFSLGRIADEDRENTFVEDADKVHLGTEQQFVLYCAEQVRIAIRVNCIVHLFGAVQ